MSGVSAGNAGRGCARGAGTPPPASHAVGPLVARGTASAPRSSLGAGWRAIGSWGPGVVAALVACAPPVGPELPAGRGSAGEVASRDRGAAEKVEVEEVVDPTAVPELPQVWSAPKLQYSLAAVDGGAGIVGRVAQPGEVMWTQVRAGKTHAAVSGRLQGRGGERVGYVDLRDGKLLWHRGIEDRSDVVVGLDGTGVGLVRDCRLQALDPATGRPWTELIGRSAGVGHSGPDGPQVHEMCVTPPLLVGQAGRCAMVLTPQDTADMVLTTVGPDTSCWQLPLGRADSRPQVDGAKDVMWWHAEATLHVLGFDRAGGSVRWRRKFAVPRCYPRAYAAAGMVVVLACGRAVALAAGDGKERWTLKQVEADALAVVGEASAEPLLSDSPGVRHVQFVTADGQPAGRVAVPDGASAHAIGAGVVIDTGESLTLWDPQGVRRWVINGSRFSAIGEYVVIKDSAAVVEARTGRVLGRDPFGAEPLAVLPAENGGPALMVMRAGYLWARALP